MTVPPDKTDPLSSGQPITPSPKTPASGFESYMQGQPKLPPGAAPSAAAPGVAAPGPASAVPGNVPPTPDSIINQVNNLQQGMTTVQGQLSDPNLSLKRSQSHLVRNKLSDANGAIRSAAGRLGVETPPAAPPSGQGPIARFLGYINDGQMQLASVQQQILKMKNSPGGINAADLLFVQLKMSQAQQEIEYSSTLLGKVMDSLKTILNTPL